MMIKLELPEDATVGDLITKMFPDMEFREKHKNLMSNYFEDIKIKRNTWDEKLDLKSLKESGILAEEQGHWIETKEISTNRRGQIVHEVICSECSGIAYFRSMGNKYIGANLCPNCGADMREAESEG